MNANSNDHDNADANSNAADGALDAEARLHAADPAAGLEPSAGFVDGVLARTVGAAETDAAVAGGSTGAASAAAAAASEPAPVHDLSAERARRRPRWLPIAAVAASIAIVGGAGFGLGATASGTSDMAAGPVPPISVQSGAGLGAAASEGGAVGAPQKLAAGSASDMRMSYGFGRNEFTSTGLSTASGTAAGYGYDARAASTPERITALAAALGIAGTPEKKDGAWTIGPQDGTAPYLYVGLDGTLSFNFSNPLLNPWQCEQAPDSTEPCAAPESLPSEQAALDALRSLITAAGHNPDDFEFSSETWEGSYTRPAQAWPVIDGRRIDQAWSIELTDAGVVNAYGSLADLVPLGDYAVVSEQEAYERLSDPRFGAQMTGMPIALREESDTTSTEWVPPTEPPATPSAGASVSWPVTPVTIVSARLGLTSQWQPNGSVLVVPAYELTDAAGGTWSVIAVADSMLNLASN